MSQELIPTSNPGADLVRQLTVGFRLDRSGVRRLLNLVASMESNAPGRECMEAQLRAVLARNDWLEVHVSADPANIAKVGVCIGITQAVRPRQKKGMTPMQKWQWQQGARR